VQSEFYGRAWNMHRARDQTRRRQIMVRDHTLWLAHWSRIKSTLLNNSPHNFSLARRRPEGSSEAVMARRPAARPTSIIYRRLMKDARSFRRDRKSATTSGRIRERATAHAGRQIAHQMLSAYCWCHEPRHQVDDKRHVIIQLRMRQQRLHHRWRYYLTHEYGLWPIPLLYRIHSAGQPNLFPFDHICISVKTVFVIWLGKRETNQLLS